MTEKEKLYETMGELLYVLAMADGVIQSEESEALENILLHHEWAQDIKWSFDYEANRQGDLDDLYRKVILQCQKQGPQPEYLEFITAMEEVAKASDGIDSDEKKVISSFSKDLIERFKADVNVK